jgi:integrase
VGSFVNLIKYSVMKKWRIGRPRKKEKDKMNRRVTVPLTDQDYKDLLKYERLFGKREHAQSVRELFLNALRKQLAKVKGAP